MLRRGPAPRAAAAGTLTPMLQSVYRDNLARGCTHQRRSALGTVRLAKCRDAPQEGLLKRCEEPLRASGVLFLEMTDYRLASHCGRIVCGGMGERFVEWVRTSHEPIATAEKLDSSFGERFVEH